MCFAEPGQETPWLRAVKSPRQIAYWTLHAMCVAQRVRQVKREDMRQEEMIPSTFSTTTKTHTDAVQWGYTETQHISRGQATLFYLAINLFSPRQACFAHDGNC